MFLTSAALAWYIRSSDAPSTDTSTATDAQRPAPLKVAHET
jgi:hypothetical protein